MTDELIGKRFGGYEILSMIGKGGMATVYRAHQVSMNRVVALKILPRQYLNDENYMMRFNREVRIIAQLEHRNIVPVHDYGEQDGQPYIVMRYMGGGSVDDRLNGGALPLDAIRGILEQIAPALDYAHSRSVLHRDIKPSNVLMDDNGGAFLTDFGIARIMGDPTVSTATQGVIGTPSYMSPEQAQGQPLDSRSDIYALGIMLFEMATGKRPFESDTPYGVAVLQVTAPPPPPTSINPNLPPAVEAVILRAIRKRREDRYADAAALAAAFAVAIRTGGGAAPALSIPLPSAVDVALPDYPTAPTPLPIPNPPRQTPAATFVQTVGTPPGSAPPGSTPPNAAPLPMQAPARANRTGRPVHARPDRWWIGAVVGLLIGCALLTLIIGVGALIVIQTQREEADIRRATETAAILATLGAPTPVDGTPISRASAESAQTTAEPRRTAATAPPALPSETGASDVESPVGVRPVVTDLRGRIVYAGERASNGRALPMGEVGDHNLYLLDLSTRAESRLTGTAYAEIAPAISPDGESVAFIANRDDDFDLYVISLNTLAVRRLTQNNIPDRAPAWSRDRGLIVFSSDTRGDGGYDLYQITPNGTGLTLIYEAPSGQRASDPVWTADGRYLLFTQGAAGDARTWEIMRLDSATRTVTALTDNDHKDWQPALAPDGRILYLTETFDGATLRGYAGVVSADVDGGDTALLYDGDGYESSARFSGDGALFLYTSDVSGRDEVYAIPAGLLPSSAIDGERVSEHGAYGAAWLGEE
ncbi:MAG: protein kinase [bacterium]|nr:protein kinase [bacterium]